MGTKNNPGQFDCYANAEPDEPMFVLLARDPAAPNAIRLWVNERTMLVAGHRPDAAETAKLREAMACAETMDEWRLANRPPK